MERAGVEDAAAEGRAVVGHVAALEHHGAGAVDAAAAVEGPVAGYAPSGDLHEAAAHAIDAGPVHGAVALDGAAGHGEGGLVHVDAAAVEDAVALLAAVVLDRPRLDEEAGTVEHLDGRARRSLGAEARAAGDAAAAHAGHGPLAGDPERAGGGLGLGGCDDPAVQGRAGAQVDRAVAVDQARRRRRRPGSAGSRQEGAVEVEAAAAVHREEGRGAVARGHEERAGQAQAAPVGHREHLRHARREAHRRGAAHDVEAAAGAHGDGAVDHDRRREGRRGAAALGHEGAQLVPGGDGDRGAHDEKGPTNRTSGSSSTPKRSRTVSRTWAMTAATSAAVAPPRFTTKPACFSDTAAPPTV